MRPEGIDKAALLSAFFTGKSDPFVTVKEGSEGREKFRTKTIMNTLDPAWKETALIAMPDVNGLLLLVRKILHYQKASCLYRLNLPQLINHRCPFSSVFISLQWCFSQNKLFLFDFSSSI